MHKNILVCHLAFPGAFKGVPGQLVAKIGLGEKKIDLQKAVDIPLSPRCLLPPADRLSAHKNSAATDSWSLSLRRRRVGRERVRRATRRPNPKN